MVQGTGDSGMPSTGAAGTTGVSNTWTTSSGIWRRTSSQGSGSPPLQLALFQRLFQLAPVQDSLKRRPGLDAEGVPVPEQEGSHRSSELGSGRSPKRILPAQHLRFLEGLHPGHPFSRLPWRPAPRAKRTAPSKVSPLSIVSRPRRNSFLMASAKESSNC